MVYSRYAVRSYPHNIVAATHRRREVYYRPMTHEYDRMEDGCNSMEYTSMQANTK